MDERLTPVTPGVPDALADDDARSALRRLLDHLEAQPRPKGLLAWRRRHIEVAREHSALEWMDRRREGRRAFIWGRNGTVPVLVTVLVLINVGNAIVGPYPFSWARLASAVLVPGCLGVLGGIATGHLLWRDLERTFDGLIAWGRALPVPPPHAPALAAVPGGAPTP